MAVVTLKLVDYNSSDFRNNYTRVCGGRPNSSCMIDYKPQTGWINSYGENIDEIELRLGSSDNTLNKFKNIFKIDFKKSLSVEDIINVIIKYNLVTNAADIYCTKDDFEKIKAELEALIDGNEEEAKAAEEAAAQQTDEVPQQQSSAATNTNEADITKIKEIYAVTSRNNTKTSSNVTSDMQVGRNETSGTVSTSSDTKTFSNTNDLLFIPNWSTEDFINERLKFKKIATDGSTVSKYNDTGMFFYRLFFNFNTGYGLFGSILKDSINQTTEEGNTAWQYLTNNIGSKRFSDRYRNVLYNKRESLVEFTKLLNYISNESPWFFESISGLKDATKLEFDTIVKKEDPSFSIKFNPDAIDMRIGTLLDLYKDACFDYTNSKEVIPENLRKFDMSIILFNPPIQGVNINYKNRYENTRTNPISNTYEDGFVVGYTHKEDQFVNTKFKKTYSDFFNSNGMSFKCLIFKNCEFVLKEMSSFPDTIMNSTGFEAKYDVKISYQRVFSYNINRELTVEVLDNLYNLAGLEDAPIQISEPSSNTDTQSNDLINTAGRDVNTDTNAE